MKSSQLILLAFSILSLTACQPGSDKKSARKVRVSSKVRSNQKFNFTKDNATDEASDDSKTETTGTNNVLCDAGSEDLCHAIRVSALDDTAGTLDGVDRKQAANAGSARIITARETVTTGQQVEIKIKLNDLKNKGSKLLIVAVSSDDTVKAAYKEKLEALDLVNIEPSFLDASADRDAISELKEQIGARKVLIIAVTQAEAQAKKTALGLTTADMLVVPVKMETRELREEALSRIGTVIPVDFVTSNKVSEVNTASLKVYVGEKRLTLGEEYGIDTQTTSQLRVFFINRAVLNSNDEIKITYTLKKVTK